jgi:hypothetical protein
MLVSRNVFAKESRVCVDVSEKQKTRMQYMQRRQLPRTRTNSWDSCLVSSTLICVCVCVCVLGKGGGGLT